MGTVTKETPGCLASSTPYFLLERADIAGKEQKQPARVWPAGSSCSELVTGGESALASGAEEEEVPPPQVWDPAHEGGVVLSSLSTGECPRCPVLPTDCQPPACASGPALVLVELCLGIKPGADRHLII